MPFYGNYTSTIRQSIALSVGDIIKGQCGATGATATKIHAPFLWQPDDYYNQFHYEVYVYDGTNIGEVRRVTDWDLSDALLTVNEAYDAACDATSYIELHRIFTYAELMNAINLAIDSIAKKYWVDIKDESTIRLTSTTDLLGNPVYTYEYALPTSMMYLYQVITETGANGVKLTGTVSGTFTSGETVLGGTSGATGELAYSGATYIRLRKVTGSFVVGETATGQTSSKTCSVITAVASETAGLGIFENCNIIDPRDYSIIPSYSAKLKLDESLYKIVPDLYLRLEGQGAQPTVDDDADIIYLPTGWIVNRAITFLPINKIESNNLTGIFTKAVAEAEKAEIRQRNYPNPKAKSCVE